MKVRPDIGYRCACDYALVYIDRGEGGARRRMYCPNRRCLHFEKEFYEPIVELQPAPVFDAESTEIRLVSGRIDFHVQTETGPQSAGGAEEAPDPAR